MADNKKTGLQKFMSKQFSESVKIGSPVVENKERARVSRDQNEGAVHVQGEINQGKSRGGRPKKTDKQEQATIIIKIDRELKKKLEDVKYMSYKSTLKDVLVEAMNDIIKKYGVE